MGTGTAATTAARGSTQPWSRRFADAARSVGEAARALDLAVPAFRSPPAVPGALRTLRRLPEGPCVVAVRASGRPFDDVVADLIEGVLAANNLYGSAAAPVRAALREQV
jgi:hypothetical protein